MRAPLLVAFALLCTAPDLFAGETAMRATGDLSVMKASSAPTNVVSAGDTIQFYVAYGWSGDGPADGVSVNDVMPSGVTFLSASPAPTSQAGSSYTWALGQLLDGEGGYIIITAAIAGGLSPGTQIFNTASITGSVSDTDPSNDQSTYGLTVELPAPDLYIIQFGMLESAESGFFSMGEKGVPFEAQIYYFNMSGTAGTSVVVNDTLPAGTTFLSANPAPASVSGQILSWNLNTIAGYGDGMITMTVRPDQVGQFQNTVHISSTETDRDPSSNASTFVYDVVPLLQPIFLKPAIASSFGSSDTIVIGKNPRFEGLAKAGSTVTIYEGSPSGCFGDFSLCNPVVLGSVVAGSDRRWSLVMAAMSEARTYHLYVRAELNGDLSAPPYGYWFPIVVSVDSALEAAGVDLANFVVGSAGQERRPGFAGGSTGTTPNEPISITIRQSACDAIETTTSLWANHTLRLIIDGGEVMLPVGQVVRATPTTPGTLGKFDFNYVIPGQSPGTVVEVWYRPVAYDSICTPLVALTYVRFVDILIDPAGYVYDVDIAGGTYDWPEVPPSNALITHATVSAQTRAGDDQWELWDGAPSGQVNPQVTDATTPDNILLEGYYAFYVPSGQYRVEASASGYMDHTSPILTVVDAPVFYNVGMNRAPGSVTSIGDRTALDASTSVVPEGFVLEQNYPNPFNPTTTIAFALSQPAAVTLRIYDGLGRTVATLAEDDVRSAGRHSVSFDASGLASGMYLYSLKVKDLDGGGTSSRTRRLLLLR